MLDPSNEYVENVCLSLVREYLIKREFPMALKCLNKESAPLIPRIGFYGSRLALGKDLGMEGLMKLNKEGKCPFKSMLEVLIKSFLQDKELLLRTAFLKTSNTVDFITSRSRRQEKHYVEEDKILKCQGRAGEGEKIIIGAYSTLLPNFLSQDVFHSKTRQHHPLHSQRHHPFPYHVNGNQKLETQTSPMTNLYSIEKVISSDPFSGINDDEREIPISSPLLKIVSKDDEVNCPDTVIKNSMQVFYQKLKEAKVSHSRGSLSLDQSHQDDAGGEDEYKNDLSRGEVSWTSDKSGAQSKSPLKALTFSVSTTAPALPLDLKRRSSSTALPALKINEKTPHGNEGTSHVTLGQTLLESKQNLLAQVSLSPEENEIRQQAQVDPESSMSSFLTTTSALQPLSTKSKVNKLHPSPKKSFSYSNSSSSKSTTVSTDQGFKLYDIDSLRSEFGTMSTASKSQSKAQGSSSREVNRSFFEKSIPEVTGKTEKGSIVHKGSIVRSLDLVTWRALKGLVLGERGIMQEGWIGQGFAFKPNIPYGLVQKKGGPCGILAVVQALLLRNLIFGSQYCDVNELPIEDVNLLTFSSTETVNKITSKRSLGLIGALVEILWRCGSPAHSKGHETDEEDGSRSVTVCLTTGNGTLGPGSEFQIFFDLDDLQTFVETNLHRFDCIGLLYSVVLTRGIQSVEEDMDFQNSPLLGQHGYCTQELMNLLTVGRGISNAFDHEVILDEKILKGISCQGDIGLLSLFEHYNSCNVGSFLKNPRFPLWIVCSESHFSLLFSNDMTLVSNSMNSENEVASRKPKHFDLYYYDGLARQEKIIKLSISCSKGGKKVIGAGSESQRNNNIFSLGSDDDLIPPLEKCIRTKWNGVTVDWNDTEPIL